MPALGGESFQPLELVLAASKGVLLVVLAFLLGVVVLPRLWRWIAYAQSRELSLLAAVTLAVSLAAVSGLLGLSIAFGAFLAGLAVSENAYGRVALSEVMPLRELFASVFFISIGMLIEPRVLWEQPERLAAIVSLIVIGKGVSAATALRLAGLGLRHAVTAALVLAQAGEFSFVMARASADAGVTDADFGSVFLLAAVASVLLSPALVSTAPLLVGALRRAPGVGRIRASISAHADEPNVAPLHRHAVICGYGGAGASLVRVLSGRALPYVIVDDNPLLLEVMRSRSDVPLVYGDPTRPEVLEAAGIREARMLAVVLGNPNEARTCVTQALTMNPGLDVVSLASGEEQRVLRAAGAVEAVDPEFEAGMEFVRHVLHRFGVNSREIAAIQARWRQERGNLE